VEECLLFAFFADFCHCRHHINESTIMRNVRISLILRNQLEWIVAWEQEKRHCVVELMIHMLTDVHKQTFFVLKDNV